MFRNRIVAPFVGLAFLSLLGGCSLFGNKSCHKPQVYEEAQTVAPLRIPVGLDPMDTRGALKIPDLNEPEAPRATDGPCLDEPPPLVVPPPPVPAPAAAK